MSDFETTLQKTQKDIETLQGQIRNMINALTANHELFEVDLVPITSKSNKSSSSSSTSTHNKTTSYALLSQSFHYGDQNPDLDTRHTDDQHEETNEQGPTIVTYEFDPNSTFLFPIIDKWVWGTTITNVSREAAPYPELNISKCWKREAETQTGSGIESDSSFSIEFTIHPIPSNTQQLPAVGLGSDRILLDIPFQDAFHSAINGPNENDGLSTYSKEKEPRISPGCKAWVTATFQDPIHSYDSGHKLNLHATLFSSGRFQWSQKIGLSIKKACLLYQDPKHAKFHLQILTGLTRNSQGFHLERVLSQSDKSLTSGLRRFLIYLKYKVIDSAQPSTDPTQIIETYANFESSLLHGTQIKVQRNSGGESYSARVLVLSRTKTQETLILRLVRAWISTENASERRAGLRGISFTNLETQMDSKQTEQRLNNLFLNEIELMTHLVLLDSKGILNENRDSGLNWFRVYIENIISTDSGFFIGFKKQLKR